MAEIWNFEIVCVQNVEYEWTINGDVINLLICIFILTSQKLFLAVSETSKCHNFIFQLIFISSHCFVRKCLLFKKVKPVPGFPFNFSPNPVDFLMYTQHTFYVIISDKMLQEHCKTMDPTTMYVVRWVCVGRKGSDNITSGGSNPYWCQIGRITSQNLQYLSSYLG